eukprot:15430107-Alexandrium_andersonii.AAC.1
MVTMKQAGGRAGGASQGGSGGAEPTWEDANQRKSKVAAGVRSLKRVEPAAATDSVPEARE